MTTVEHLALLAGVTPVCAWSLTQAVSVLWLAADVRAAAEWRGAGAGRLSTRSAWTGEDWVTVTVIPVAFGRWGVCLRRDPVSRIGEPVGLVAREPDEGRALARARELLAAAAHAG